VRRLIFVLVLLLAGTAKAQQPSRPPVPPPIDSPNEVDKLKESCLSFSLKGIPDCAEELFTGKPVHIAAGSLAPQDGFGLGLAYVGHKTTENWRNSWDADAVGSTNGSWRAGLYIKFVHTPAGGMVVHHGPPPSPKSNLTELPEHTVFGLYGQVISLNKLTYFGLGPFTSRNDRSFYGMTEGVIGGNVVKPFYARLNASLYGEMNGRFVSIRSSPGQPSPSVQQVYTEATAPGLTTQPGTLQLGEGVRIRPIWAADVVRLNYSLNYQQYVSPTQTDFSFQRLVIDLGHEFALYGKSTRVLAARPGNGPDDCSLDPSTNTACPKPYVRNFEGTIGFRVLTVLSMTPGGTIVPFYFQPTIGGADINGNPWLSSYEDYRFRAPDLLVLRESFEHSIWNLPIGFSLMADEGKVALRRGDLGPNPWLHSFSAGLTLRAGGFPQVYLLFSWGGKEGTHTVANVNPSLLGGSARPSLF
jgi:hypothetical protein